MNKGVVEVARTEKQESPDANNQNITDILIIKY